MRDIVKKSNMRKIRTTLTIMFLVFSAATSFSFNEAHACSCMAPESPEAELEKFQAVFSGKVTEIEETHPSEPFFSSSDPVLVTLDVDRIWKGLDEKNSTVTVTTSASSASCGFYFQEHVEYVVYAFQQDTDSNLQVSLCSRTNTVENASEDFKKLGEGIMVQPDNMTLLAPLKQFKMGSDIHDIECKSHLTLIFKEISWNPACVKPSSVEKLLERGWATDHDPDHSNLEK